MAQEVDTTSGLDADIVASRQDYSRDSVFISFDSSNAISHCSGDFLGRSVGHIDPDFSNLFSSVTSHERILEFVDSIRSLKKSSSQFTFCAANDSEIQCDVFGSLGPSGEVILFIKPSQQIRASHNSVDRFNSLIGSAGCYLWELDLNETFLHVSSGVESVLGYKNYELIGQSLKRINSREEYENFSRFYDDVKLHPRMISRVKKKAKTKEGMEIPVEVSAEPMYDQEGALIGYRGFTRSLQESISENRRLEQFRDRYNTIITDSRMWFWEIDADRRFTYLSKSFTDVTGISLEDSLGRSCNDIHNGSITDFQAELNKVMENHRSFHRSTIKMETPSGKTLILSSSGAPFYHDNGEFAGYRGHNRCITSELETKAKLAESEHRFKNIVESSNTWFWEVDPDLNLTYLSANFSDITGYDLEEHLGKSIFNIRDDEEKERLKPLHDALKDEQKAFKSFVGSIVHKDGRTLHIESSGIPIVVNGELKGWRGSNRNITNEVQYRRAIEESETRFRQIVESSNAYFWEVNLDLEFTYLSGNFESLTGYKREETLGKTVYFLHTKEEQEQIKIRHPQILASPEVLDNVRRVVVRKDGSEIMTVSNSVPVYEEGKLIAFRGHERDITPEYNLENELSSSLNQTQAIVSSLPDMIFVVGENGDLLDCKNPDPKEIGDPGDFVGKNLKDIYSPHRAAYFLQILKDALADPRVHVMKYSIRNAVGEKNHYECRVIKIEDRDDQVLAVIRNVTQAHKASEKLESAMAKLQRSNEELEQFAFVASHDLQEPIRLVSSYVKLLKQSQTAEFSEKDSQYIAFIEESCQRMKTLVIDLLEFSKLEAKELKINRIDVKSLFDPVLLTFDKQIREKNAILQIGRMPQVMCDPVLMSQVFANLISNALKFHKPNQSPKISISAHLVGAYIEFKIQDSGLGIPEDERERIFNIFHRGNRTNGIPGSGIGMAVCRKIVNRHGGKIWISGAEGEGTTVHFTIPEKKTLN